MGLVNYIDLTSGQRRIVLDLIDRHLPGTDVWAYGSRVTWTSRPKSDLDLVVFADFDQHRQVANLREAFEDSDLPFRVDVLVWDDLPESFRDEIDNTHVVLWKPSQQCDTSTQWRELAVEDIAEVVGGGTPSTRDSTNFGGQVPWLTPRDLSRPHDRYVSHGARSLTTKGLASCSARLLPAGSVLLSTRAPIGYVAIAKNPIATNQGFQSLIPNEKVLSEYMYYWLTANIPKLEAYATGSTFPELSARTLKKLKISVPPLSEQDAIVHVLGKLDDKIELNRRMNVTLESMFQSMVAYLLTDRLSTKSQGCHGWKMGQLGDIASAATGLVDPVTLEENTPYIGLEHMPRSSVTLPEWGWANDVASKKMRFRRGDILFGKLRPYFHKVGFAPVDGVCSTDIIVMVPRRRWWQALVLGYVFSSAFVAYSSQTATGTKMPRTNWSILKKYPVVIPTDQTARDFQKSVDNLFHLISANVHENLLLIKLRTILQRDILASSVASLKPRLLGSLFPMANYSG